MRRCEDCKLILESDARFCPKCGKSVGESAEGESKAVRLAALLSSANLHKLRQEWSAAVSDAAAALEIDPNNADVASMLASIYEQQGNAEEAAVWYRIALELEPQNSAHRAALNRVTQRAALSSPKWEKARRAMPTASAAVALVIVTVLVTLAVSGPRSSPVRHRAARPPKAGARIEAPSTTPGSGATAITAPSTSTAGATAGSSAARTPGESALKSELAAFEGVRTQGAVVDDVIADPRQGVVVVTFSLPGTATVTRAKILSAAAQVARAAFAANAEVRSVTTRCIISPAGPTTTQIAFVGDVTRSTMDGLGENPTDQQLEGAFTAPWWNPQIR